MAYASFTPDPDYEEDDFGYGWFEDEDGSKRYGYDPVEARRLMDVAPPPPPPQAAPAPQPTAQISDPEEYAAMIARQTGAPQAPGAAALEANAPRADVAPPTPGVGLAGSDARRAMQEPPSGSALWDLPDNTRAAILRESERSGYSAEKLARLIKFESGGNTSIASKTGKHAGLIQFSQGWFPDDSSNLAERAGLGRMTWDEMRDLDPDKQMRLVTQYLKDRGVAPDAPLGEHYLSVAASGAVGSPDDRVVYPRGSGGQRQNPAWDLNKDQQVTAGELRRVLGPEPGQEGAMQSPGGPLAGTPAAAAAPAGAMPGGMVPAQTTVRGVPLTPGQLEARQRQIMDQTHQQMAMEQMAGQARIAGRQEAMAAVEQNHDAMLRDRAQQTILHQTAAEQARQKIENEFSKPVQQVDPLRYIKNMGAGERVLGAIAMLVSAIGQGLASRAGIRMGNMAMEYLDQSIANDIASQKDAIDRGERQQTNRVAHWTRVMNDEQQGVKLAMAEAYQIAARRTEYHAKSSAENADIAAATMQKAGEIAAKGQALAAEVQAQETERLTTVFQPPKPVPMQSPADAWKQAEAESKLAELQGTGRRPEQNKELRTETQKLGAKLDDVTAIRNALTGLYDAAGIQRDDAGNLTAKDIPGKGPVDSAIAGAAEWPWWSGVGAVGQAIEGVTGGRQERKAVEGAQQNLVDLLVRERTGAAVTKAEADQFSNILGGDAWREGDFLTKLRQFERFLEQREREIRGGASDDAREEYERRARALGTTTLNVTPVMGRVQ